MLSAAQLQFTIRRNRRRCFGVAFVAGLLSLALVVCQKNLGLPLPPTTWFVAASPDYWNDLLAIAQFVVITCFAYLALEIFRASGQVETIVMDFFESPSDRPDYLKKLIDWEWGADAPPCNCEEEKQQSASLRILIRIHQLCALRARWLKKGTGARAEIERQLDDEVTAAKLLPWFNGRPGQFFLRPFHSGADTVLVGFALYLTLLVHLGASMEKLTTLYMPGFMATPIFQAALLGSMLIFGVALPVFYVMDARSLLDQIKDQKQPAKARSELFDKKTERDSEKDIDNEQAKLDEMLRKAAAAAAEAAAQATAAAAEAKVKDAAKTAAARKSAAKAPAKSASGKAPRGRKSPG